METLSSNRQWRRSRGILAKDTTRKDGILGRRKRRRRGVRASLMNILKSIRKICLEREEVSWETRAAMRTKYRAAATGRNIIPEGNMTNKVLEISSPAGMGWI